MRHVLLGVLLLAAVATQNPAVAAESFKPFKLKTLEGSPRSLPDVLGKATVVVFFFPTCHYCNAAFPQVQKIYDAYKDRGLVVLAISLDAQGASVVNPFVKKFAITFPVGLDPKMAVRETYGVWAVPSTFLIDKQGKRVLFANGAREWDGKAAHALMDSLLK